MRRARASIIQINAGGSGEQRWRKTEEVGGGWLGGSCALVETPGLFDLRRSGVTQLWAGGEPGSGPGRGCSRLPGLGLGREKGHEESSPAAKTHRAGINPRDANKKNKKMEPFLEIENSFF